MKQKKWQFRNWLLFVGLYEESIRRRIAIDRSGIDINEGNDKVILGVMNEPRNAI